MNRRSVLPNCIVIGAMKCGTTALWSYLAKHPEISMSETKELDFFIEERNWNKGVDWYMSQFHVDEGTRIVGEASPNYTKYPSHERVPERMAEIVPEARLIYCVRDPVERMRSEYLHWATQGDPRVFDDGRLVEFGEFIEGDRQAVQNSLYAMQIDLFAERFSRQQILVVPAEDLRTRRRETMAGILSFLGVDSGWWHPDLDVEAHVTAQKRAVRPWAAAIHPIYERVAPRLPATAKRKAREVARRGPKARPIDPRLRAHLRSLVVADVRSLRGYLGPDFHGWGIS